MNNLSYSDYTYSFSHEVYLYGSIFFVPVGLTLNLIQLMVFNGKDFRKNKSNMGFLMKVFVVADSMALFWNFVIYQSIIGLNISLFSSFTCALFLYLSLTIQQIPLFFQTFITFVNYLSVVYPSQYARLNKKKYLSYCFVLIVCFVLLLNAPSSFRYLNKTIVQRTSCDSTYLINLITTIQTALVRFFLPFLVISTLNLFTLRRMIKSKCNLRISLVNERRFAFVIEILGFIFVLFNFPFCLLQILHTVFECVLNYSFNSNIIVTLRVWRELSRAFAWLYYGMGFFINISFNRIFRKNFFKLISIKSIMKS